MFQPVVTTAAAVSVELEAAELGVLRLGVLELGVQELELELVCHNQLQLGVQELELELVCHNQLPRAAMSSLSSMADQGAIPALRVGVL